MPLDDEKLWDYMMTSYQYVITQFGIGVVGLGALFLGYGVMTSSILKELIALIGLACSSILCMHIFGANMEIKSLREELRKSNPEFSKRFDLIGSWRYNSIFYFPVTKMIHYFMVLLSLAWLSLVLFHIGFPLTPIIYFDIFAIAIVLSLGILWKLKNFRI